MKNRKLHLYALAAAILLLSGALPVGAQNVIDLVISEVLPAPSESGGLVDEFGRREGWIEIFNTSQGTVNIGGCFLTDDRSDLRKSMIPKGDQRTLIGPRQTTLFHASGRGEDGTFYTSFTLEPGSTVYLVSNDGRTVIDSLRIPSSLPEGMSVSKASTDLRQMDFQVVPEPTVPTPRVVGGASGGETNAQRMARDDPHGFTLSVVSVSVVFTALAILWFFFWLLFERPAKKKAAGAPVKKVKAAAKGEVPGEVAAAIALALDMDESGETYAAIAAALHLYFSEAVHDSEPFIITIRNTGGSAWSDKRATFRKRP